MSVGAPRPLPASALEAAGTNLGLAASRQIASATVQQVSVSSGSGLRTGDIVSDGAGASSGIQAASFTTGLGSSSQALVSIAGGVTLGDARR
jgi:hypothetical protein